jgi:TonB family protein
MSLLTHLWQSTLCVGVAAVLAYALRHAPARTRHVIWLVASLKFLMPLSLLVIAGNYSGSWVVSAEHQLWGPAADWLDRSWLRWSMAVPADSADLSRAWLAFAGTVWLVGGVAVALQRWRQWRRIRRVIRGATPLDRGREADALCRVMSEGHHRRSVQLLLCASRIEPGVVGLIRPALLWPAGLSDRLTDDQLDAIMTHEICHIDRRDNASAVAQMLVETLFWFHPMVWWMGARLIGEREQACDDEVVRSGADRESYAKGILTVCRFCLRSPTTVLGVGGSHLAGRIERIMTRVESAPIALPTRLALVSVIVAIVVMPLAAGVLGAPPQTARQEPYRPGEGVTKPVLVKETKPSYTPEAMRAKIQGQVLLQAIILADGRVGDVKVTKSLDTVHGLDKQAVDALKQWRFKPGTKDKKPVPVQVEIEMVFTLK